MIRTLTGLLLLIIFYSGAYQFVKERFKLSPIFIALFIHITIMIALYAGGLIGLLQPTAWLIGSLGILSFGFAVYKNWPALFSDLKLAVSQATGSYHALFKRGTFLPAILLLLMSAFTSFTLMNISINIWVHDQMRMLLIWVTLTCLVFPLIQTLLSQAFKQVRQDRGYRLISIIFFAISCAIFLLLLSGNAFLAPRTDRITITNLGPVEGVDGQSEITFLELKEDRGGEKLAIALPDQGNIERLMNESGQIVLKGDEDQLLTSLDGRGPNTFEFLFLRSPTSGLVKIDINGDTFTYNLTSESVSQKRIIVDSRYQPVDVMILLAHFVFIIILLQILARFLHIYQANEKDSLLSRYAEPILILFLIGALFLFTRTMQFYVWDEFSHWGIFIKELAIKNKLPTADFCTVVPRYIPGITLFEYFFTAFLGFSEGHAYFAYLFFVLSEIAVVLLQTSRQALLSRLLYLAVMVFALFLLPLYFVSLYVDVPLGLMFGAGLIFYHHYRSKPSASAGILLIFCGLQLMKTWGLVFSLLLSGIILIDQILLNRPPKAEASAIRKRWVLRCILFLALSTLLIQVPWQLHIQRNEIARQLEADAGAIDTLLNREKIQAGALFRSLIHITIKGRQEANLTFPFTILNLGLLLLGISLLTSSRDRRLSLFNAFLFLFYAANIGIIFLAYLVYFPVEESVKLASYERYVSEFLAGWLLFVVYQVSSCFYLNSCPKRASTAAHGLLAASVVLSLPGMPQFNFPPRFYIGRREELKEIMLRYEAPLFDGNIHPVFHIAQNTNGLTHHALRYELCPNTAQIDGWSFGEPYPDEITECDTLSYSIEALQSAITSGYEYVLVTKPDSQLWQRYGELFNGYRDEGDQLFEVKGGAITIID